MWMREILGQNLNKISKEEKKQLYSYKRDDDYVG